MWRHICNCQMQFSKNFTVIVLLAVCDDNWNYRLIISNENTILAALSETANIRNVCSVYYSEQWSSH